MSGSNYTSRESYAAPVTAPNERGPDPRAASQVSGALAQGFAEVSSHFMQLWSRADYAQQVNDATAIVAKKSMDLADMERGFAADPDPATVPARFREAAAQFRADSLKDLAPGVQQHVGRQLDAMLSTTYRQVAAGAYQRHIGDLRATMATTIGTNAQGIAAARDEPQLLEQVQAAKQAIAGNVHAGVIQQADAVPLFSHAIRQAVTIRASAADPGAAQAAQALLDRFKGEMDPADVAALSSGLRGPLERAQGETAATAAIARSGGATNLADAIMAQESGGRDGQVSVNGARGRMQITPATFAQYAQPGESIDNPADNRAVGERIIADLSAKSGGDPARIAVGYFSGPGNIAPAGSPTPWKEDRRDGNGMSVSRYVAQVTARLAPAGTIQAQREAAVADVRTSLADAPLHVRLSAEAHVAEHFTHLDAQNAQQRALLGQQLHDLEASYATGQTTAPIPEDRIRALAPNAEAAQRTIDGLNLTRSAGDAIKAVAFASPADITAQRARLAGDPQNTYLAAERQQLVGHFDQAVRRIRTALKDDPGGYAMTAPEVQQLIQAKAPLPDVVAASLAAQQRMGVLPGAQRVLSGDQLSRMVETLRTTGPEKQDMSATLSGLQQQYGPELWNRAFGELVHHGKLPWEWQAVAAMTSPTQADGRARLQAALKFEAEKGGHEALRKLAPPDDIKGLEGEVASAMSSFREALRYHPGGDDLMNTMRRAVDTLATSYVVGGMKASAAATRAYADVVGARWDTAGDDNSGLFGRSPTMLVPKGRGGEIETALERTRTELKPGDLAPLSSGESMPDAERQAATLAAARRGLWVNNADASGAVLKGRTPGGSIVNLARPDGSPIEVKFGALPTWATPPAAPSEDGRSGGGPSFR